MWENSKLNMAKESFSSFTSNYLDMVEFGLANLPTRQIQELTQLILSVKSMSGMVWLVGNGGSGCLASHMATDLQLGGVRAQSLTDFAAVSTYGNDISFEDSLSEQVKRLVQSRDLVIVISTSGKSPNLLRLASLHKQLKFKLVTLTGHEGGELYLAGDLNICVGGSHTGVIQDLQQTVLHLVCYWLIKERG